MVQNSKAETQHQLCMSWSLVRTVIHPAPALLLNVSNLNIMQIIDYLSYPLTLSHRRQFDQSKSHGQPTKKIRVRCIRCKPRPRMSVLPGKDNSLAFGRRSLSTFFGRPYTRAHPSLSSTNGLVSEVAMSLRKSSQLIQAKGKCQ